MTSGFDGLDLSKLVTLDGAVGDVCGPDGCMPADLGSAQQNVTIGEAGVAGAVAAGFGTTSDEQEGFADK